MAFIKNTPPNIYIWENRESSQELLALLKEKEIHRQKIKAFKSQERIIQYLTNRLLVQEIIGNNQLLKGANNKPFLENSSLEISFSHNKKFTVLMTSNITCGVDIQSPTEKAVKVKHKFINKNDFCIENNGLEVLSKAWSCKEAAFKKFGNNELYLKENITILNELENNQYEVLVEFDNKKHEVTLQQEKVGDNYLFYTIN